MAHATGAVARAGFMLTAFRHAVHYASVHTGVPAVVVASVALVAGYHLLRRTVRFAVQLTIAMTIVLLATYFGWLSF
ncbi:MAG TPA: hypothetical protein VLM85_19835 [Polyangiaceae bacterium]|nr:hypothetical protein [Polyangiaceae bacterium]